MLTGRGYRTAESVFRSIERGEVGRRRARRGDEVGEPAFARKNPPSIFRPNPREAQSYRENLNKMMASARTLVAPISLRRTPTVLRALGAPDLPITITRDVVRKATNGVRHTAPMAAIEQLPEELADPLLVFDGGKDFPSHVILTEHRDLNGKPVLVALHLQKRAGVFSLTGLPALTARIMLNQYKDGLKRGSYATKAIEAPRKYD